MKKGQITAFIVIGLIIVASIAAFYFARERVESAKLEQELAEQTQFQGEIGQFQQFVQSCIDRTAINTVILTGLQGGFLNPPYEYFQYTDRYSTQIGYSYNEEKSMQTKDELSVDIADYFLTKLDDCLNYSLFPSLNVNEGMKNANVLINPNNVYFDVNLNLDVSLDDNQKTLDKFQTEVDINLGNVYDYVNGFVSSVERNPKLINYSYLVDTNFETVIIPLDLDTLMITVFDASTNVKQLPYLYMVVLKFDEDAIAE